jgi:tripartite-type tricarboxylate transporter receptor subunit TctC
MVDGALLAATTVSAQGWKPERNVELTIPTSPGGSNDIAGRLIHKLWTELKLLPVTSSVVNRSGAEHIIAYTYVSQRGDPHTIGLMSTPMLVNPIEGRTQLTYNDVTPIAYLITEPMVAVVRADSPLKTGKDLVEALRKNPAALSIALTSRESTRPNRLLGGCDAPDGKKRRDCPICRKEHVARRVQGSFRYAQMAGRRVFRAQGDHDRARSHQAMRP